MLQTTITLPEIGEITIKKNRQSRNIRIKIKPPGVVWVSMPLKADFKLAEKFIHEHKDWIKKHLEIARTKETVDYKAMGMGLKDEAQEYLPKRLEYWSEKTGLKYKNLRLVNVRRYWGMCMRDDRIKLNVHLIRLPQELADYIILHELAHTREKNHSPRFYEFLGRLLPNHRELSRQLKQYALT